MYLTVEPAMPVSAFRWSARLRGVLMRSVDRTPRTTGPDYRYSPQVPAGPLYGAPDGWGLMQLDNLSEYDEEEEE